MDNVDLRRRLLREHATELLFMCAAVGVVVYLVALLFASALETGTITLNAGGRFGKPVPVTLEIRIVPFAVVGFLLIFVAFVAGVARLVIRPAYQVLRLSIPGWQLPRVPRWRPLYLLSSVHFTTLAVIAGVGALLVAVQYVAIVLT